MRLPFNGSFPLTQAFNDPCCRASYRQFGLNGHDGRDYGLPAGTPVVASINGLCQVGDQGGVGYGKYIFINGVGLQTVVAHLQTQFVATGQPVSEGQLIGLSDNTGFSTAAHLHFGARPLPYNANNGFAGYVDPLPLLNNPPQQGGDDVLDDELVKGFYYLAYNIPGSAVAQEELDALRGQPIKALLHIVTDPNNPRRQGVLGELAYAAFVRDQKWQQQIEDLDRELKDCKAGK